MAKGKYKQQFVGMQGSIQSDRYGDWEFIYKTSTSKDSPYNIGDLVVLPDGREYRYGLSTTALITPMACQFTSSGLIAYTAFVVAAAVGDKSITCPAAAHDVYVVDELRGGYVVIFKSGVTQFRGIVGNDATAANVAFVIYLDGGLDATITTSSAIEVYGNPYRYMGQTAGNPNGNGFGGPPAVAVSAASMYFWMQTKGPTFINPQSTLTASNEATAGVWRSDGSMEALATAYTGVIPTDDTSQYAGYRMGGSYTGNGPLFYLQG